MKKILGILLLLLVIGGGVAYFMYNKPHTNTATAKADFQLNAGDLFNAFQADENASNAKYLDKVIQVKGKVQNQKLEDNGVYTIYLETSDMMGGTVSCQMAADQAEKLTRVKKGDEVGINGICTGYLMDVVMVRCSLIE
ncbi:MAG: hypothetical protein R2798_03915 [Chitinophagales bacterium]|nr:hypothetical protein [Bacteroidota bacterium]